MQISSDKVFPGEVGDFSWRIALPKNSQIALDNVISNKEPNAGKHLGMCLWTSLFRIILKYMLKSHYT